jgi:hypothetical protein
MAVEVVCGNEIFQADMLQWPEEANFGPHHIEQCSLIENNHRYATISLSDFQRAAALSRDNR